MAEAGRKNCNARRRPAFHAKPMCREFTPPLSAARQRRFAVNLPLDESRTAPMSPDELARLGVPLQTPAEFPVALTRGTPASFAAGRTGKPAETLALVDRRRAGSHVWRNHFERLAGAARENGGGEIMMELASRKSAWRAGVSTPPARGCGGGWRFAGRPRRARSCCCS